MSEDLTFEFARAITDLGRRTLSGPDIEQIRRLSLDYAGVTHRGATLPWARSAIEWAGRFAGSGRATIVGAPGGYAPSVAALVNGTAAHSYELDDTHDASLSHPGSVVISAALAVAGDVGAGEDDLLSAIACGYEAMTRLGMAAGAADIMARGRHPTALFGPFGSAAAAARLYGLDAAALACAWGHVLSLTGGSMQFSDEPAGTAIKRVHAGYAAQNGVLAAEFAARDIGAPARALDGKYGFFTLFTRTADTAKLRVPLDEPLQLHRISIKPYSCCRLFHSLIDGLEEVTDGYKIRPEEIARVHVRGPAAIFDQHMLRRPASSMAAQYSLPFVVGATLVFGPHRFDAYGKLQDEGILAIADRVEGSADPEIEKEYPAHLGTAVDLGLVDGTVRTAQVMDSRGTPARPLAVEELRAKAVGLVREARADVDPDELRRRIWDDGRLRSALLAPL